MEGTVAGVEVDLAWLSTCMTVVHDREKSALECQLIAAYSEAQVREQTVILETRQREEDLRLQVESLMISLQSSEREAAGLRADWDVVVKSYEDKLQEQQATLQAEVERMEAQIREMRSECEERVRTKKDELQELQAERDAQEAITSGFQTRVGELEADVRRAHGARDRLQGLVDEATKDSARISAEVVALEALADRLIAAASPLVFRLVLDMDISAVGVPGSADRSAFEEELLEELAAAAVAAAAPRGCDMSHLRFRIAQISGASVGVEIELDTDPALPKGRGESAGAGFDLVSIAADFQRLALEECSSLRAGRLLSRTRHLEVQSKSQLLALLRQQRDDMAVQLEESRLARESMLEATSELESARREVSRLTNALVALQDGKAGRGRDGGGREAKQQIVTKQQRSVGVRNGDGEKLAGAR